MLAGKGCHPRRLVDRFTETVIAKKNATGFPVAFVGGMGGGRNQ
jgi:hypothetical protein